MDEAGPIANAARTLNWNLLHTFVVIVEAGGITAGADKLGRRQPTISNALRRLEEQIGKRLINRGPGTFELTGAGKLLYREAVDVYGAIGRLQIAMREVTDTVTGHVTIAIASHIVCPNLDRVLGSFHRNYPEATLSIDVSSSVAAFAEVTARRASLAIGLVNKQMPTLRYRHLYRQHFGLYCGPDHELYGKSGLQLSDLAGHSSVGFPTDRIDDVLRPIAIIRAMAGLNTRIVGRSSNLEEVRRLTVAGLGISAFPIHAVVRDVQDGLLWRLPPYEEPPEIDVHVAWNPRARLNRAEAALLQTLVQMIDETPMDERTYGR